jgi:tRNA threonylcarbamoyladenosine biosynthesis protein TsaB
MPKNNIKILAIETSSNACSAALLINSELIERYELAPLQHTQLILPMVQNLLAEATIKLSQLDAIAFGCGPGSFTGVRIAASVTKGLAFGANLPVITISTLRALAQGAFTDFEATKVLPIIDARIHEVYFGMYMLIDGVMQKTIEDDLCDPKNVLIPIDTNWFSIGDGWDAYHEILNNRLSNKIIAIKNNYFPRARDIAKLAQSEFLHGNFTSAEQAIPVYLRNKVVK